MKCLNQEGLKYLWSLIKGTFATQDELSSKANSIISGLTTTIEKKVAKTDIIDNLDTDDTAKVLSASMGYEINQMFTQAFNDISTQGQAITKKPDYEEGTFTPTLSLTFSGTKYAGIIATAYYKKIGKEVHIKVKIEYDSALASSTTFYLWGLPLAINPKNYAGSPVGSILIGEANINGVSSSSIASSTGGLQITLPSSKAASQVYVDCIYWI